MTHFLGGNEMKKLLAAIVLGLFAVSATAPVIAQDKKKDDTKKAAPKGDAKKAPPKGDAKKADAKKAPPKGDAKKKDEMKK